MLFRVIRRTARTPHGWPSHSVNGHQLREWLDHKQRIAEYLRLRPWKRHPKPFAKTLRGYIRWCERQHIAHLKQRDLHSASRQR